MARKKVKTILWNREINVFLQRESICFQFEDISFQIKNTRSEIRNISSEIGNIKSIEGNRNIKTVIKTKGFRIWQSIF